MSLKDKERVVGLQKNQNLIQEMEYFAEFEKNDHLTKILIMP